MIKATGENDEDKQRGGCGKRRQFVKKLPLTEVKDTKLG